jgi:hypothetical protein
MERNVHSTAHHRSLSWGTRLESALAYPISPKIHFHIILQATLSVEVVSFPMFPTLRTYHPILRMLNVSPIQTLIRKLRIPKWQHDIHSKYKVININSCLFCSNHVLFLHTANKSLHKSSILPGNEKVIYIPVKKSKLLKQTVCHSVRTVIYKVQMQAYVNPPISEYEYLNKIKIDFEIKHYDCTWCEHKYHAKLLHISSCGRTGTKSNHMQL